jgi:hypothetical protein
MCYFLIGRRKKRQRERIMNMEIEIVIVGRIRRMRTIFSTACKFGGI